jgi:RNA polymerase sigma-70 factor (ECF subfamily)
MVTRSSILTDELIARAAGGDAGAMQVVLAGYRNDLLDFITRNIPAEVSRFIEPQDVYQDVCIECFRRLPELQHNAASLYSWLIKCARSRLVDLARAYQSQKRGGGRIAELAADESLVALLEEVAVFERTPSRSAVARELVLTVKESIERLPDQYQELLRLRFFQGLTLVELADRLGRSNGAVTMAYSRALKLLRQEMRSISNYL